MAKKQATFDISDYVKQQQETRPEVEYKPDEYVNVHPVIQKAIKMPGFPLGHMSMIYGLSDSGKTSLLLSAVKSCQEQGILPILLVTENKLTKKRIINAGIDLTKVLLVENVEYLEDAYNFISSKIQEVLNGELPIKVMIFWDSVAGAPSKESFEIDKSGKIEKNFDNRKNANVVGYYNSIIANRIAETRKVDYAGSLGLVMITQAYMGEKPKFPPGLPAPVVPNGGEKIWFPLSVAIEVREGQRVSTTVSGEKLEVGLISKVKVKKNHLSEINSDGEIVFAGQEVLENDSATIKSYLESKKEDFKQLLEVVNEEN